MSLFKNSFLPKDLASFLLGKNSLDYNLADSKIGKFELADINNLKKIDLYIENPENSDFYYENSAIDLIQKCDYFQPGGLLVWLPEEKMYGSWDCDHWQFVIFPSVNWTDIILDPLKYINAQWQFLDSEFEYFQPQGKWQLRQGRPF